MDGGIRVESLNEAGARRLQEEGRGDRRESKRWKAEEKGIRGGGIDRNRSGRGGRTLTIGRGGGAAWRGAPAPIVLSTN